MDYDALLNVNFHHKCAGTCFFGSELALWPEEYYHLVAMHAVPIGIPLCLVVVSFAFAMLLMFYMGKWTSLYACYVSR
ncbi:hypothetical protein AKJ16_DCAP08554 [Drosera capensis]